MLCERIINRKVWPELEKSAIGMVVDGGMAALGYYRDAACGLARWTMAQATPAYKELEKEYFTAGKNPPTHADLEATAAILRKADSLLVPMAGDLACGLSYLGEETVKQTYRNWLNDVLGDSLARKIHIPEDFFASRENVLRVILDGLDGTANFSRGLPLFCSAAAILVDDQPRVAAMYDPIHNVVYSAVLPGPAAQPEEGAWASMWEVAAGKRLDMVELAHKQPQRPLKEEAVAIHLTRADKGKMREMLARLGDLSEAANAIYALNNGIPSMALVARGGLGAFVNNFTNLWDVAAGEVIARACGMLVTDFHGQKIGYDSLKRISLITAKPHLHSQIMDILSGKAGGSAVNPDFEAGSRSKEAGAEDHLILETNKTNKQGI